MCFFGHHWGKWTAPFAAPGFFRDRVTMHQHRACERCGLVESREIGPGLVQWQAAGKPPKPPTGPSGVSPSPDGSR